MTEATLERPTFELEQQVSWKSGAAGSEKKKVGRVVAIVPEGQEVDAHIPAGLDASREFDGGIPRAHESYLILVDKGDGTKPGLYWPVVSKLKAVKVKEPKVKKLKKEPLQVGKTSLIVDGKEVVFNKNQSELPGMPELTRLRKLADAFVVQNEEIEEEQLRLFKIRQAIMLELKQEGRTEFGFRKGSLTYSFSIVPTDEKIKVQKKN